MPRIARITLICFFVLVAPASAEELPITQQQLDNLGIETDSPVPLQSTRSLAVPARVRVPLERDFAVVSLHEGTIKQLLVASGVRVQKGQALAHLASAGYLASQRDYLAALSDVGLATDQYERDMELQREGIVSKRRLAKARSELDEARTRVAELKQLLRLSGMAAADIEKLQTDRRLVYDMVLRAPIDGTVLEQFGVAGQRVGSSDPVYRIADLKSLWLDIDVPYEQSLEIRPDDRVQVRHPAGTTGARVLTIGRRVSQQSQTVVVRAVIEDNPGLFSPGQLVSATLTRAGEAQLWELPAASVIRRGSSDFVFVRTGTGLEVREVSVSGQAGGRVAISGQLRAGDEVVTAGTAALKARWLGIGGGD